MSIETMPRLNFSRETGHLAIEAFKLYAMFQAATKAALYPDGRGGVYSYGLITARGGDQSPEAWVLTRTDTQRQLGRLVPQSKGPLDVRIHGNTLVLPMDRVDDMLEHFKYSPDNEDWPPSSLPAEKLFRCAAGQTLGDMWESLRIEACATFDTTEDGPQLTYVDKLGGYSVGSLAAIEPAFAPDSAHATAYPEFASVLR